MCERVFCVLDKYKVHIFLTQRCNLYGFNFLIKDSQGYIMHFPYQQKRNTAKIKTICPLTKYTLYNKPNCINFADANSCYQDF